MLEIKKLFVNIGKKTLLKDIELFLRSGELNIIIGPNGAGKSTLLKAIINLVDYRGEIVLNKRV